MRCRAIFGLLAVSAGAACTQSPGPPPTCEASYYVVDGVDLPDKTGEGNHFGIDLDGDGNVDNAFSSVVSGGLSLNPDIGDVDAIASARLAGRDAIWLVGVGSCDDGGARVELRRGTDLDGDGVPELVAGPEPFVATVPGVGRLEARHGEADVPLTVLADPLGTFEPIAWTRGQLAGVELHIYGDSLDGVVAFALPMPDSTHDLLAPYAAYLTDELRAGKSQLAVYCDANHDGVCSPDELAVLYYGDTGQIVQTLIAPDVRIDGGYGLLDGLSVGIAVRATHVAVEP